MKKIFLLIPIWITSLYAFPQTSPTAPTDWCQHPPRPALQKLTEIKTSHNWFKVYQAGKDVFAIIEPYNFEEVISYLILGKSGALLFDTGMGMDSISPVISQLTSLPVTVINSHTHYDHIGGNYEFSNILAMPTDFTMKHAKEGWSHADVQHEVTEDAFCRQYLPGLDTARYHIRPFRITKFVKDGDQIDLGGRTIQIIAVPGHTPDAIALLDTDNGYLWSGDTFYEGAIYLFREETDIKAYEKSVSRLAALAPKLKAVFPAHNNPITSPKRLTELKDKLAQLKKGEVKGKGDSDTTLLFQFEGFGFLIGKQQLAQLQR